MRKEENKNSDMLGCLSSDKTLDCEQCPLFFNLSLCGNY